MNVLHLALILQTKQSSVKS